MGEGLFAKNLRLSFDAGFRGRHKGMKAINIRHARLSLREAADVLRTHRRAARGKEMQMSRQRWVPCSNSCSVFRNHSDNCHQSFPTPAQGHRRSSKIKAGGNHESSDATKSVQEARKMRPRDAQEHS